jgi:predicted nucleic acid-binding protein
MSGNLVLLDTNIVLYILGDKFKLDKIPNGNYCVSFITEIELLSYPLIKEDDEKTIRKFLNSIDIIDMNDLLKEQAILFRKKYHLKLPDSIICATAFTENAILITNDEQLKKINEIEIFK